MRAIARVCTSGAKLGITNRKHAMLWLFQNFALSAGLYGCQVWSTNKLSWHTSTKTRAHIQHLCFLKSLLGVKKGTEAHAILRETRQMPFYFYWFRCVMRFWNSLLTTNSTLLREIGRADLQLANKKSSWSYQVLTALNDLPNAQQFTEALHAREKVNMDVFEKVLCDQVINVWRELDHISPQEAHASSRVMRTYHSHFGIPLGSTHGYWDAQRKSKKPRLPHYLRLRLPPHLSRALSCIRLSGHNLRVETLRHGNRCPYELRICDKCDWHVIQDEEHIVFDCESEDLVQVRVLYQHLFASIQENNPSRLKELINQDDAFGVAAFIFKCLGCCS